MAWLDAFIEEVDGAFPFLSEYSFRTASTSAHPNDMGGRIIYESKAVRLIIEQERHNELDVYLQRLHGACPELSLRSFTELRPNDLKPPPVMFSDSSARPRALSLLAGLLRTHGERALTGDAGAFERAAEKHERDLTDYRKRYTKR